MAASTCRKLCLGSGSSFRTGEDMKMDEGDGLMATAVVVAVVAVAAAALRLTSDTSSMPGSGSIGFQQTLENGIYENIIGGRAGLNTVGRSSPFFNHLLSFSLGGGCEGKASRGVEAYCRVGRQGFGIWGREGVRWGWGVGWVSNEGRTKRT